MNKELPNKIVITVMFVCLGIVSYLMITKALWESYEKVLDSSEYVQKKDNEIYDFYVNHMKREGLEVKKSHEEFLKHCEYVNKTNRGIKND